MHCQRRFWCTSRSRSRSRSLSGSCGWARVMVVKRRKAWVGRSVAFLAVAAAVGLGFATLDVVDRRPRTHDAHLFAYSAGMSPEVSGRIIALHIFNNQRVEKDQPLVDIDPEPFD